MITIADIHDRRGQDSFSIIIVWFLIKKKKITIYYNTLVYKIYIKYTGIYFNKLLDTKLCTKHFGTPHFNFVYFLNRENIKIELNCKLKICSSRIKK